MTRNEKSTFRDELASRNSDPKDRRWNFVPYDQLSDAIGPLSEEDPDTLGIVLLECPWKAAQRPYHKQKLALVLANMRHFALEQAERGVAVDYRAVRGTYGAALRSIAREKGGLRCMRPAELELRHDLAPVEEEGLLEILPHAGWLTTREQFEESQSGEPPWRMDAFYRLVRRESGYLMGDDGKPLGGKFSFDA
ncbi:MAG: deoxyribodipyrimidine photolyase-related protein, partial [Planctomycetota bacterium]